MIINPSTGIIIMIDLAREIIGTQPILAAFLAIGLGYLVGQVNLGGFWLGVGAVFWSVWPLARSRQRARSRGRSASRD